MRWDNLTVAEDERSRLPGYREQAVVRRFKAPEALDIRFYEVRSKSALNRVPERSRMPFRWTINPYRGCTHACTFCLCGQTPILTAGGRAKPLSELQVGDAVYGTVAAGRRRRLVPTRVLAKWQMRKPAHAVSLSDGRRLVASGDHRFLTDRGWAHVESGPLAASMSAGDRLLGLGAGVASAGAFVERGTTIRAIEPLGEQRELFDITTGTGDFIAEGVVSHNCFARPTHAYLGFDAGRDFEREIVVKVNAPELLRRELARPSWTREHVALGTNTDPYQWVEGRYRLMEGIWEAMRDFANPCSVLTKSPLLLRDIELMRDIARVADFKANLSIPTLDERAWRATEPHTPNPRARIEAVAELSRSGIPVGVLIAPLIPGVNDDPGQVAELVEAVTDAGASSIGGIALHLRGEVRELWFDWLRQHRPDLIPRYESLYRRGAYVSARERERISALARPTRPLKQGPAFRRDRSVARGREDGEAQTPVESAQTALF